MPILAASMAAVETTAARSRSELLEQDMEIQQIQWELERAEKSLAARAMTAADFDTARSQHAAAAARTVSLEAAVYLAEARIRGSQQLAAEREHVCNRPVRAATTPCD